MNKTKLVALVVTTFLLGEALGVTRAKKNAAHIIKKHKDKNEVLKLKMIALRTYARGMDQDLDPTVVARKFDEDRQFIEMIEKSM